MATGNANRGQNVEDLYPDMFGKWSSNDITNVFGNLERTVTEKMQQDGTTKQQLLSQPGNSKVFLSQLLMNISLEGQQGLKDITSQEKRVQQNKVTFLIALAMKNSLSQDALAMFIKKQYIKEANAAYRKYIIAKAQENYERMIRAEIDEREKLEALMNQRIMEMLAQIQKEIEEAIEHHDRMINHHQSRVTAGMSKIHYIIDEQVEEYKNDLNKIMSQSPAADIWNSIPENKKDEYARESMLESINYEIDKEVREHEISGKELALQDINAKIQEMEQNGKLKVSPIQPKQVPGVEFRTVTPQFVKERIDQNELVKDPQYKSLIKDREKVKGELGKLKEDHKKAEITHQEHQVKLRESKFGKDKVEAMVKVEPNFHKIMDEVDRRQNAKVHEKAKEHKLEVIDGKKEVNHHKTQKETNQRKEIEVYANLDIPKPKKIARLD